MGFIYKKPQGSKPQKTLSGSYQNNISKDKEVMNNKISVFEDIITDTPKAVKRIKKDKGLIERTESSKTILTEENKELLMD